MTTAPLVSIKGLSHQFGNLSVVDNLNLDIGFDEFTAIIGPSGCGKSSLLRVLAGLLAPTSGSVTLDSQDVVGQPGKVAYLPQGDTLLPWLRALDNAIMGATVMGVEKQHARAAGIELFERFGLETFEQSWPHELSGGMKQRVAVLRTMLLPHRVLTLDEPFGALDALTRHDMQQWFEMVWMQNKRSTILVTHDIEEAILLADRVLVMSGRPGRFIEEIEIDLPRPRQLDISTSPHFTELKRVLLDALKRSAQ